jgi:hypothetical protein
MSVGPASPIPAVLTLGNVTTTGTAAPGTPATFSFELSAAANVALRWQGADGTQAETPPEPRERGPQTLTWDAAGDAGLGPGAHDAVIVADNGVDQVFSAAQKVSIPSPTPSPEPSPNRAEASGGSGAPTWLFAAAGALGIIAVAVLALVLVRKKPSRHSAR